MKILNKENIPEILDLWKSNREFLGIPFKQTIEELIYNESFFGVFKDNQLIGMCAYKIIKKNPQVRITKLCVKSQYRRNGIATQLISHIVKINKSKNLDFVAECKDGAENNYFYNKIGKLIKIEQRKTMSVRFYEIIPEKLVDNVSQK